MIKDEGEIIMSFLVPGDEWGVLRDSDHLLNVQKMSMMVPSSKQLGYVMSSLCDTCSDGTILVFNNEIEHLRSKLPFTCQHNEFVTSVELGAGKDSPG